MDYGCYHDKCFHQLNKPVGAIVQCPDIVFFFILVKVPDRHLELLLEDSCIGISGWPVSSTVFHAGFIILFLFLG